MSKICSAVFLCLCLMLSVTGTVQGENRITRENALPGATDWQLTRVKIVGAECRSVPIEGYCSKQSVAAGEALDVMVSTNPARAFRLEIFRTGY
jgi:hypothetical protein